MAIWTKYSGAMSTSNGYIKYRIELTLNSQDVANNRSNVTVAIQVWRTNGYTTYGSGTAYCTINGSTYTASIDSSDRFSYNSYTQVFSKTLNISHDSDGSKTLSMSARIEHSQFSSSTQSWSQALNTIPRASIPTLSSGSINYGEGVTIYTNRKSSSFTHTIRYNWNGHTGIIATGVETSYYWVIPNSFMNYIPSSTSTTGTIYVDTYSGSNKIGTKSISLKTNVPSSIKPSISTVDHSEYVGSVASKVGSYVQGISRLSIAINGASGSYSSSIKSYKLSFDGETYNSRTATSGVISSSGSLKIIGTVTDSRGRTASKSITVNVLSYEPPKLTSFAVERCNSDGTANELGEYAKITRNGCISTLNSKNTYTYKFYSKSRNTSTWTLLYEGGGGDGSIYSGYVITSSYDFKVELIDLFNTTIATKTLSTGTVTMSWGKTGIGIGKIPENGTLDVGGTLYAQKILAGTGNHSDGDELLRLYGDRHWSFMQEGEDASASLLLKPGTDNKNFVIRSNNGMEVALFSASVTDPYVKAPRIVVDDRINVPNIYAENVLIGDKKPILIEQASSSHTGSITWSILDRQIYMLTVPRYGGLYIIAKWDQYISIQAISPLSRGAVTANDSASTFTYDSDGTWVTYSLVKLK